MQSFNELTLWLAFQCTLNCDVLDVPYIQYDENLFALQSLPASVRRR